MQQVHLHYAGNAVSIVLMRYTILTSVSERIDLFKDRHGLVSLADTLKG